MEDDIYIQSKGKINLYINESILLGDLINVYTNNFQIKSMIKGIKYDIKRIDGKKDYIISILSIIALIKDKYPASRVSVIGDMNVLVSYQSKKNIGNKILRTIIVCFLLSVGAATAIMNFHSDVDMLQTQKKIYYMITGKNKDNILLLQIPYSLGIGVGMTVFFNHFFNKKINDEPSPLELEVHSYQQNVDQYIKEHINKDIK